MTSSRIVSRFFLALALWFSTGLDAQETWTAVSAATTQNLWSVVWGNNTFVAVGEGGAIVTSPDGTTWTPRASGNPRWLVGAGYGNGLFVVVGDQGTILTSPDGIAWTGRTSGTTARINGVAFGGGRWLAVAESGEVLSSTDASTWTKLQPSPDRLRGLTYAYGQFVITGDNGLMRTTVDTVDYDAKVLPDGRFVESVVNARRTFLAVGENGYAITSSDAVTWTRVATSTAAYLRGVTFFNGVFIAAGSDGTILTTADPNLAWMPRATGTAALFTSVAASNVAAVVVGFNGTILRSAPPPSAPVIVMMPRSLNEVAGGSLVFEVAATGSPPLAYQWLLGGQPLAGETTDRLFLANVQPGNAGSYSAMISNPVGSVTSSPATLTIVGSTASGPIVDESFAPTLTFGSGITSAVEQADGKLVVGGSQFFSTPGVSPFALARLNVDGSIDPTFDVGSGLNQGGTVSTLVLQPDGRIMVGGSFSFFNGVARTNVLRLNPDGSLDPSYVPAAGETLVPPPQVSMGKILRASGNSGFSVSIFRLNTDGTRDTSWRGIGVTIAYFRNIIRGSVFAAAPDGKIIHFHEEVFAIQVGGDLKRSLLRYHADAARDFTFDPRAGPDGAVNGIVPLANGKTILFGAFTRFDGVPRPALVRLLAANAVDVQPPVFVSVTPEAAAVTPGANLTVTARVAGSAPLEISSSLGTPVVASGVATLRVPTQFSGTYYFTFTAGNRAGSVTSAPIRVVVAPSAPILTVQPASVSVRPGRTAVLSVDAAGSAPFTYEWFRNGTRVGTGATLTVNNVTAADAGDYTVIVRNSLGSTTSQAARLTVDASARLANISTRASVAPGEQTLIAGFVIGGTGKKDLLIRGAGPALAAFALAGLLPNPVITLYDSAGRSVATNDNWNAAETPASLFSSLGAFPFPGSSPDSALRAWLDPGSYTLHVADTANRAGLALAEIYENDGSPARLANLSSRAFVGLGANLAISGIAIQGQQAGRFLIRGIGPALTAFGVAGALTDPVLVLTTPAGVPVASNDNWSTNANAAEIVAASVQAGAFPLAAGSRDAALLVTLPPGNYTALVSGAGNTTGVALVEIYEVP